MDIAPLSHAFETDPASERLYSLMNHEMVHEAEGDLASDEDRRWRRFFFGKVTPQSRDPESLLYSYLTIPRYTAPRWYLEGAAVFMETWMSGGIGRAQGGYDEMVFRAMVRDGVRFYDPLGLVSRGVQVDFQVGANAYLYGTRFFTWLAYAYSPQKVVDWIRRDEGSERNYADQFLKVFGIPLEQAWQEWIGFEHEFQRRNLEEVRSNPITPHHKFAAGAIGSISRMYYDESTGNIYAGYRYTGVVEHIGALNIRDGSVRRLVDIRRAMLYRVASVAYDPASGTLFYTDHNLGWRDLMSVDVKTGESKTLFPEARIGEIVFNPADRSLIGVRHSNGIAMLVRLPYPYTQWFEIHTFPYEYVPYDLDISADGRLLSAVDERSQWRPVPARLGARQAHGRKSEGRSANSASGNRSRRASSSPRTRAISTGAATTPASPTFSAMKSPPAQSRPCPMPSPVSFVRCRSTTEGCSC